MSRMSIDKLLTDFRRQNIDEIRGKFGSLNKRGITPDPPPLFSLQMAEDNDHIRRRLTIPANYTPWFR